MDFYLLGNGFDLYHRFPTKYNNFLHTVDFLLNYYDDSMTTVGKILGDSRLHEQDGWIKLSYETHKGYYDATQIKSSDIRDFIDRAKGNLWYAYLLRSYNRDLGWIDFEKEVSKVIDAFHEFFVKFEYIARGFDADHSINKMQISHGYIIRQFPFFYRLVKYHQTGLEGEKVFDKYITEIPLHSGSFELNKELIAKELFDSLMELGSLLREYLKYFVEETASRFLRTDLIDYSPFSSYSNTYALTFNYTNLYERLCRPNDEVCHIHGSCDTNIVLGINPTKEDDTPNMDTTFLRFKKYYQRVLNRTDDGYLSAVAHIRSWKGKGMRNHLTVFGHSLDRTDEDVIRECFDASDTITVYYYEYDFHSAVRNLVAIYGKEEFDNLRRKKSLTFKPQPKVNWEAYKNVQLQISPL